ncbi:MAG: serine--tRNA ligase [Promethearchaeota archaeon]
MLDIKLFRENIDIILESQKRRFKDTNIVHKTLEWDVEWRRIRSETDALRARRNKISKEIGKLKKEKKDASALIKESKEIGEQIEKNRELEKKALEEREKYRYLVGNILHDSVPIGETEESNEIVFTWGKPRDFSFKPKIHVDLVELVDGVELKKAQEIAGSRMYYLKNDLVLLNFALLQFGINFLISKGFSPMWTPFFINHDTIKKAAELADFEEQLYKIQGEDLYLIATSEQTLAALHKDEIIDKDTLPLKYCGISSCFRREAGAHGRDTLGIFRIHQFEKIEQFIYTSPEHSWEMHEHLIDNAKEIYKQLGLHFRVVNIASGEMNDNAAKKYDLEAWFPGSGTYRELVSCSNCTDYQARKLNIRYGKQGGDKDIIHTLNSTAIATERTICCILENYQREDGTVEVPKVLQPYMNNKKTIEPWKK